MFNPAWLFVLAAVIADVGILLSFKKLMSSVQTKIDDGAVVNANSFQQELSRFFISVAIAESIPILLIVFGFMQMELLTEPVNILFPLVIVIAVFLLTSILVFTIRGDVLGYNGTTQDILNIVNTQVFIGLALLAAIPTVAVVALFIMAGM